MPKNAKTTLHDILKLNTSDDPCEQNVALTCKVFTLANSEQGRAEELFVIIPRDSAVYRTLVLILHSL